MYGLLIDRLFGFSGRMGRGAFVLAQLFMAVCLVAGVVIGTLLFFDVDPSGSWGVITGTTVLITTIALYARSLLATTVKRLHDLGHSGGHVVWIVLLDGVVGRLQILVIETGNTKFASIGAIANLAFLSVLLYLSLWPGSKDSNTFGPSSSSDTSLA